MSGWLKIHRQLMQSPVFENEKLFKIFMYCLMKASHKEHEQLVGKQVVTLKPGQFVFGRKRASLEANMPPSTVWSYLLTLQNLKTLDIKSNNKFSVITIVNWGFYQHQENNYDNNVTTDGQQMNNKWTTNEQQMDTNKNVKKGENVKNDKKDPSDEYFETWWNLYKKKKARPTAKKAFDKALKKHGIEKIMSGTEDYMKTVKDKQFQPHPSTFLNQERYMDEIEDTEISTQPIKNSNDPMADIRYQMMEGDND